MIPLKQLRRSLRSGLSLLPALLLAGCDAAILNPKGQIGHDEKTLLITSVVLMLLVVIPVIVMTLAFAWRYRASNTTARYEPNWSHSTAIEVVVWSIPCMIILVLAVLTWRSSHALDPYKPLDSKVKPIVIEAVALDWKWMFIYPEQGIATVNEIAFPVDTPLNFRITSDTVMNSFFIPHLGTQIYAMAGMETKLHLIANAPGDYFGLSANYSGHGFSKMGFTAHATDRAGFDAWVAKVKAAPKALDQAEFQILAANRNDKAPYPVTYYASVQDGMFKSLIHKYMMGNGQHMEGHGDHPASATEPVAMCTSGDK
ncbi:ubiquinol oxidase subunit II [Xanthomonas translucens]|uniref:Ubiquinol oxidase subunit 2 n=1 Tax=Xanthomonas translucens pv. translucens DSM 18974 TaxID=1261556 RepID=A0A1C3TQV6_XANCT|nr:ubiquinol oxidase subunit II [Xanthomonas translucens]KTF37064.1 cytochrome C oxidase subunit II [Xanthomonas translucens pv. translucens]KWV16688.1 cytochrome ubiquinol oxidase subunit II [Xanthomonas translucens]MCC8447625.1 ubiquinol oxidase subunit II [Xanthomonas translucens pv. translucens]MCS3360762.1 ubiquinol oxidase subunit II [Xanthomonas translucens pv. translucens]MCS3373883.1 ubiquinol oxidase subunit II [Xanthomonas translucens pv. translucens]